MKVKPVKTIRAAKPKAKNNMGEIKSTPVSDLVVLSVHGGDFSDKFVKAVSDFDGLWWKLQAAMGDVKKNFTHCKRKKLRREILVIVKDIKALGKAGTQLAAYLKR